MIRFLVLFLFSCFCSVNLQGNDIDIQLAHQSTLTSEPGKVNNFSVVLLNNGDDFTKLRPHLDLPEGWKTITNMASISLEGREKEVRIISFVVPAKALAGAYEITYRLVANQTPTTEFTEKFTINVQATNKLKVIPLTTPATVLAGSKIKGQFLVKNNSNQSQTIFLSTDNAKITGETTLQLPAFSSKKVIIEMATFGAIRKESRLNTSLKATIKGSDISKIAYLHNQILPSIEYEVDDTRKLPGYASLNYIHRQFNDGRIGRGWQGELFLQGTIDEKEEKEVTLSLRGPNQQDGAELTLYDQYFASYKTKSFSVIAGDNSYALSTLTEFSRNGRGIQAEGYFGTATVGAFYVKPRFFAEVNQEIGVFIQNEFNARTNLRFNYLHKQTANNQGIASTMSVSGQFSPFKNTFLLGEVAAGNSGQAFFLKAQTRLVDRFQLSGNLIYASPNFGGYFQNTLNLIGNASYKITKKTSLVAGIFQDSRNAALDTLMDAAPLSDRRHVGIRFRLAPNSLFQLNLRQNEIEDRLPQKQFFRKENLVAASINHKIRTFNFSLTGEYGQSKNFLQTKEADFKKVFRGYLDMGIKIQHFSLRLFSQYYNENSLERPSQKQLLFGGAISGTIKEHTQYKVRYQNDFEAEVYYKNRNAFDFFLTHQIRSNQQLILNARQTIQRNTLNNRDFAFSAKYVYQFDLRLEEKPPTGNVYGQIQKKNNTSAKGIIVLMNGKRAITDEAGHFQFKSVKPGKYPIMLDPSTLALHEILADSALPIVEVLPETNQHLNLTLIESGAIIGGIEFKKTNQKAQLIAFKTVGNLLLEASNGTEIRRTFTDDNGQYKFGDLKPGTWKVEVLKRDLDKKLKIAQTRFTIEIKAGEAVTVPIIIQQKKRNIQFKRLIQLSDDDG